MTAPPTSPAKPRPKPRRYRPRLVADLTRSRKALLLREHVWPHIPDLPACQNPDALPVVTEKDELPVFLAPVARRGP